MPSDTDAWARKVTSPDQIPAVFREFVPALEPFPHIVYSPPDSWGSYRTNAKLTCLTDGAIYFLEKTKTGVTQVRFALEDIDCIEQGVVLLYSWIAVRGTCDGRTAGFKVEYNTVMDLLFNTIVQSVRQKLVRPGHADYQEEMKKLNYLVSIDFKYMNYSRFALLPGQSMLQTVYQPAIGKKVMIFFYKRLTSAHLLMLTDTELILIQDEEADAKKFFFKGQSSQYGGIWQYIPLHRLHSLAVEPDPATGLLVWSVTVQAGKLQLLFSPEQQTALERFNAAVRAAKGD
ncbi:Hypothetical protein LUCI_5059 [Lucifera butyrica]|uniref:Uncharacterized protein n=1 Tax=Lucifera butyrica TaxID=1351585 RepID=A0A498RE45_9FIRM|nr:hypothetical protein [Lucifera butyrica]VBB09761.1 Hypothetical protein LUCI_5059 [Lucifera butyrica]